jgi:dipeptidyl aminopeptidase/acylaminoacyl peptidase
VSTPHATGRVIAIRILAGVAPVLVVWLLLLFDRWPGQIPRGEISQITYSRLFEGLPSLSPDGEWLAYRCEGPGTGDICVSTADGRDVRNLTASSADEESAPSFSPDGLTIAFHSARGGISLVPRNGGDITPLTSTGRNPAWTPDGRSIIYAVEIPRSNDRRVSASEGWRVDTATGFRSRISGPDFQQPAVSPANKRIAYWGRPVNGANRGRLSNGRPDVWTIPAEGGTPVRVTDDASAESSPMWSPDGRFLYYVSNRNGTSALWRIRINERTGRTKGNPEIVRTPSSQPVHITHSADGRRLAWSDATPIQRLLRVEFDADARRTRGASIEVSPDDAGLLTGDEPTDLEVQPASGEERTVALPRPPTPAVTGHWSPDRKLFAGTAAGSVWIYSSDTRAYEQFRPGANPVWLNDSRRLIYDYGGQLFMADAVLKISRELLSVPDQQLNSPRLSGDNRYLYYSHAGVDANLWVMNVRSY